MKYWVVEMRRNNDPDKHSYVLGVFHSYDLAYQQKIIEEYWRGGKYTGAIDQFEIDQPNISMTVQDEKIYWFNKYVGDLEEIVAFHRGELDD